MTTKQFNQSVTDSIKNLVNKTNQKQLTWPDNFSDWLKSNGDSIEDHGGNVVPDRVQANHERYAQQGEERSIPF